MAAAALKMVSFVGNGAAGAAGAEVPSFVALALAAAVVLDPSAFENFKLSTSAISAGILPSAIFSYKAKITVEFVLL